MVGEGEVSGMEEGEEVHFSRVISIAGASSYRLNGKEVGACTRTPCSGSSFCFLGISGNYSTRRNRRLKAGVVEPRCSTAGVRLVPPGSALRFVGMAVEVAAPVREQ